MTIPQPSTPTTPAVPIAQSIPLLQFLTSSQPADTDPAFLHRPYAHPLDNAQLQRRASILFRQAPYTIHPCTQYSDTGKKLPNIEFTIDELTRHLKSQLGAWNVLQEDPWLVGGAASHVMDGGEYSDVDLCFYLKKNDQIDELQLVLKSVRSFIRKKLIQLIPHEYHSTAFIDANYLYRKIRVDGFSFINLGDVDLKFILGGNHRLSVAASDGFHVPLSQASGMVCCVDGYTWCNKAAFDQALANLKSRKLSLKGAKDLYDIAWRLTHRTTQGYRIVSEERLSVAELSNIALRQIMAVYPGNDPMALERFQKKFFTHQDNHYPHNRVGRMSDFINLLSFLQAGRTEPDDDLQLIRNEYIRFLANAWLNRLIPQDDLRKVPLLDPLVRLIAMDPSQTRDLLAVAKGLLLLEWMKDPYKVPAYTFPFAENAHVPRLHVALPYEIGFTSYVSLEGSPVETAKQFLRSWRQLEDQYTHKPELDIFNKMGVGLGLNMPDLSKELRDQVIHYLSTAFLKPPVTTTLEITYKNTPHETLASFYEFLHTEMGVEADLINVHKHMHLGTLQSCLQDIGSQNADMAKLIHELKTYVNGMHAAPSNGNIQLIFKIVSKLIQEKQQSLFVVYPKLSSVLKDVILRVCRHVSNPTTPYSDAHPAAIRLFLLGAKIGILNNVAECTDHVAQLICGCQTDALGKTPAYLVEMYNLIQSSTAWTKGSDICQQQIQKLYPIMSACALATAQKLVKEMHKEDDAQLASFCLQMAHSLPNASKDLKGLAIVSSQFLQRALTHPSDVHLLRASQIASNMISMKVRLEEGQYQLILRAGEKLLDQFQGEMNPNVAEKFLSRGLSLLIGVANSNMQPEWQKHCRTLILTHIRVCLHSKRSASEIEQIYSTYVGKIFLLNQITVKFPNECEILEGLTKADFDQFLPLIIRDFTSAATAMGLAPQATAPEKSEPPAASKPQTIMQLLYALGCKHAGFNQLVNLMETFNLGNPPNINLIASCTALFNRIAAKKPKAEITAHSRVSQFVNSHFLDIITHVTMSLNPAPELLMAVQKLAIAAAESEAIDHSTKMSAAAAIVAAFDKKLLESSPAYFVECYDFIAKVDLWDRKPAGLSNLQQYFYKIAAEKNFAKQLRDELSAVSSQEGQIDVTVPAKSLQFLVDFGNSTADKTIQKNIQSKLLEVMASCLASGRPNMLQPLFSECTKKFVQLKSVAAGWPDKCKMIVDLAQADLSNGISQTLLKFITAIAGIDLDFILSIVNDNKIKAKIEVQDYAAVQKVLNSHLLTAKIQKFLQMADQFMREENIAPGSVAADSRIAASIQEIAERDTATCQLIEALSQYLSQLPSPPDTAALQHISTTLKQIDKERVLPALLNNQHHSDRLNGLFFGIIMKASGGAAPSTELLIVIQEITGFCVENGILKNPYASKAIAKILSLIDATRLAQSAALVVSTDAFLKSIQRSEEAGKELHSQIGNMRTHLYQQALPAAHAILSHITSESDEALVAKCLLLSLKSVQSETHEQSFREAFALFSQHVLKNKRGFGLRSAYEIAISVLKRKTSLEAQQLELMRQIGLALIALPPQKRETRQNHNLYLDIGLSLLAELANSATDIELQQQVRTLILQGMFDCLIAVISRTKKNSIYSSHFRALEQMLSAQDICKNFPLPSEDDGTHSLSPFFRRFISAMFIADKTLAASFVANPVLKSRMRTADYDDVQRLAFKEQTLDETQPALAKRFTAWKALPQVEPAAIDPWIEQINGSIDLLNLIAGLHPKPMKNNIVSIAEYVINKLRTFQQESDEWKKKASEKITDPLLHTHLVLHKIEAPKLAERLCSAARACGILSQQDLRNSLHLVIRNSGKQIPTLHLMQQFLTEFLEQPLETNPDKKEIIQTACILIKNALQSKETALHKSAHAVFQKLLQLPPNILWTKQTEALLVNFMSHRSASDAEELEFNKILADLAKLFKKDQGLSQEGSLALMQATVDSGRLWTSKEISTAIHNLNLENKDRVTFTILVGNHAAQSSDPKLFEWIQSTVMIDGILKICGVPKDQQASAVLTLFTHVDNVCKDRSPSDAVPCAELLRELWERHVKKIPVAGNERQLKAIHSILFKICLQSGNHDLISYACSSYFNPQANCNYWEIWDNLGKALILLELKNPKTTPIEKKPLIILEKFFEKCNSLRNLQWGRCVMGAYAALIHYLQSTTFEAELQKGKETEALVFQISNLMHHASMWALGTNDDGFEFSKLLNTAKSFYEGRLNNECLKQLSKVIILQQKEIAIKLWQTDPLNLSTPFKRFNQLLMANLDKINPESMRDFLLIIFRRTAKSTCSWYKEMKAILRNGHLYPTQQLLMKDRTGQLEKISLERILAEEYCIHSMCESPGLQAEAIQRLDLLIHLVDINRPTELASLLKAGLDVFDYLYFEWFKKPSDHAAKDTVYSFFMLLSQKVFNGNISAKTNVTLRRFASRILRRIMMFEPAIGSVFFGLKRDLDKSGKNNSTVLELCKCLRLLPNDEIMKTVQGNLDRLKIKEPNAESTLRLLSKLENEPAIYQQSIKEHTRGAISAFTSFLELITQSDIFKEEHTRTIASTDSLQDCIIIPAILDALETSVKFSPDSFETLFFISLRSIKGISKPVLAEIWEKLTKKKVRNPDPRDREFIDRQVLLIRAQRDAAAAAAAQPAASTSGSQKHQK